jgi:carbamate kinase
MRIVVALGGNALLQRGEPPTAELQRERVKLAAAAIAGLARDHEVIVTHGNGPQVGLLALETAAYTPVPAYPFDILGAESQGMIGYLLESALRAAMPGRPLATLLSQVVVAPDDPAFLAPSKPIGPVYSDSEAQALAAEFGWAIGPDTGGMRRLVASPEPLRMLEVPAVNALLDAGIIVITAGGGGVPVAEVSGVLSGVEAVVDKDLTSALLAEEVGASTLLLLTDVAAVYDRWPGGRPIRSASPQSLRQFSFAAGSMAPKVEASCRFAERTGGTAVIGSLGEAAALLAGTAGTAVRNGLAQTTYWEEP